MNYELLISEPLKEMLTRVTNFVPTLLIALGILFIGWVVARFLRKGLNYLFKIVHFDKFIDVIGLSAVLRNGGIKQKPGELVSCIIYSVFMVMVLILTIKALGLTFASDIIDSVLSYIPKVIAGVFVLIVGMLIAKVMSSIVYVVGKNTDMPIPDTLARLSKWAIVTYIAVNYLKEVGFFSLFGGDSVFSIGIVFALALAFGLAGKDVVARYLDVLKRHSPSH